MTDPKPSVILRAAADRISPPGAWTQGQPARDRDGNASYPTEPFSVCWCALGAMEIATREGGGTELLDSERAVFNKSKRTLAEVVGSFNIPEWNDAPDRTQTEVVEALRRAADIAEERGE